MHDSHFHNNFHIFDRNSKLFVERMTLAGNKVNTVGKVSCKVLMDSVNTFVQVFHNHHDIHLRNIHLLHKKILPCTVDDI